MELKMMMVQKKKLSSKNRPKLKLKHRLKLLKLQNKLKHRKKLHKLKHKLRQKLKKKNKKNRLKKKKESIMK